MPISSCVTQLCHCYSSTNVLTALLANLGASLPRAARRTGNPALRPIDPVALRDSVQRLAKEMLVPGAVVILRTPNGEFKTTYGVTTWRGRTPTSFDQHVRIGSNTKTWTATVILQLVQEGRLRLDDPVSKYRPDVPNGKNITIRQLLTMRSGLYNYSESLELNQALDKNASKSWTAEQLLAISFKHPPVFAPGAKFGYSNTNTILLGLIAESWTAGHWLTSCATSCSCPLA
jgi:D-alanyl-D-alanine carboxypeptidase